MVQIIHTAILGESSTCSHNPILDGEMKDIESLMLGTPCRILVLSYIAAGRHIVALSL